jgi:hypothetical protein
MDELLDMIGLDALKKQALQLFHKCFHEQRLPAASRVPSSVSAEGKTWNK